MLYRLQVYSYYQTFRTYDFTGHLQPSAWVAAKVHYLLPWSK